MNRNRLKLCLLLLLALWLAPAGLRAGDEEPSSQPDTAPKDEETVKREKLCATIRGHLEELRKKKFKRDVAVRTQTADEFRDFVGEELDKEFVGEDAEAGQRCLELLGLIPQKSDLPKMMEDLIVSQAGAYYDPAKKHFVLLHLDFPPMVQNPIILHELQHALQDQYFNLDEEMKRIGAVSDDAATAYSSIVEGEATLVMTMYTLKIMMPDLKDDKLMDSLDAAVLASANMTRASMDRQAKLGSLLGGKDMAFIKDAMEGLKDVPNFLFWSLHTPYLGGQKFIFDIYREKGWEGVDAVFANPPVSTEQILHPEKYFVKDKIDTPEVVTVPEWKTLAGEGWTKKAANTLGELGVRCLFEDDPKLAGRAGRYAWGWDGDVYQLHKKDDQELLVWMSAWDSEKDCAEFAEALGARMQHLLDAESADANEAGDLTWIRTENEAAVVQRFKTTVLMLRGPEATLKAILAEAKE